MSRVPASCPAGFQGRYTVIPGDTFFQIAQRLGVSLNALIAANPHIPNPAVIFPGDVLCVPGFPPPQPPCCLILRPVGPLAGSRARGVALVQKLQAGGARVSIVTSGLPAPSVFGAFETYIAEVFIPATSGGFGNELLPVLTNPPTRATAFDVPPQASLTGDSTVQVAPFSGRTGQGPVVLSGRLSECAGGS